MKRFISYLVIAGTVLLCSCRELPKAESSNLYRNFDLVTVVGKMNVAELKPLGSTGSSGQSISEATDSRRNFTLFYQIEEQDGKRFDEEKFFSDLKSEVAKKIGESDIRITGTGSNDSNFHFSYSKDKTKGWLEIVGARLEGNRYKLWCVMREEVTGKDD